jgi:hypothetical protein
MTCEHTTHKSFHEDKCMQPEFGAENLTQTLAPPTTVRAASTTVRDGRAGVNAKYTDKKKNLRSTCALGDQRPKKIVFDYPELALSIIQLQTSALPAAQLEQYG